ncbi:MAG: hypothetical protein H6709_04250 [Kofleriaceae bacterium]|nr:hypothetical protein [Kofleriaceae bacterium]
MRPLLLGLVAASLAAAGCGGSDVSREVGARCDVSAECDDRCLMPGGDWPGGFCTLSCDSDADCPSDARCVDDEGGVCLFECALPADCGFLGAGWTCTTRDGRPDGQVMVCRGG